MRVELSRTVQEREVTPGKPVKMKAKTISYDITDYISSLRWSGASTQASRQVSFSLINDPYDKNIKVPRVKPGDTIKLFKGREKKARFVGRVPNRQLTSDVGTTEVIAYDYLHNMISSTMSKKFKNKTPEYITKAVLKECGISAGSIVKTKRKIKKFYPSQMSPYNIIIAAYRKVKNKTGKEYFIRMNGTRVDVIEKGEKVSTWLEEKVDIFNSNYEENADGVVNKVTVFKNNKKVGSYKNDKSIQKYGIMQKSISVDKGKGKREAENAMKGISKTASISVIGDWSCTAGKGVYIKDTISGLTGLYWIKNDTHKFENGIHTMDLDLEFKNVTESVNISTMTAAQKRKNKSSNSGASSGTKTIYTYKKKAARFTAYYPGEDGYWLDGQDHRLCAAEMTCAAARSLAYGTKIIVKDTGTSYDGKTYKVTDRPKYDLLLGRIHIDLLLNNASECDAFGERNGYIWIKKKKRVSKKDKVSTKAAKVVEIAKSYVGKVRYKFGIKNVPGGVSDCSGFTRYCFHRIGVEIGGDTVAQSQAGKYIQKGRQKKGDLVIFQGTWRSGPSHVGIMVNKKNFIHCSSSGGVKITPLNNSYHVQHFHSIRRVV